MTLRRTACYGGQAICVAVPATAKQKEDEPGEADLKNYTFDNVEKLNRIGGIKNVVLEDVKINGRLFNEVVKEQNPLGISDNN
jgi:hypothetical protein